MNAENLHAAALLNFASRFYNRLHIWARLFGIHVRCCVNNCLFSSQRPARDILVGHYFHRNVEQHLRGNPQHATVGYRYGLMLHHCLITDESK